MAPNIRVAFRRFEGTMKKSPSASAVVSPLKRKYPGPGVSALLVAAVVETVRVLFTAAVPEMLGAAGEREQPGASLTLVMAVVTAQVRFTVPVKPFAGVRLIVAVSPLVAPRVNWMLPLLLSVNPG